MPPFVADLDVADDPVAGVLAAVANARQVIVVAEALAAELGSEPEALWRLAGEAEALGWVARWPDAPKGPCLALTPASVASLGLVASHDGCAWLRPGEHDPSVPIPRAVSPEQEARLDPDLVAWYPTPPDELMIVEEERQRFRRLADRTWESMLSRPRKRRTMTEYRAAQESGEIDDEVARLESQIVFRSSEATQFPVMRHLIGLGLVWPIAPDANGACGACHGGKLRANALCLWCGRSGQDYQIRPLNPDPPKAKPTAKARKGKKANRAKLKGGVGA